jgi:hypothetical protein
LLNRSVFISNCNFRLIQSAGFVAIADRALKYSETRCICGGGRD